MRLRSATAAHLPNGTARPSDEDMPGVISNAAGDRWRSLGKVERGEAEFDRTIVALDQPDGPLAALARQLQANIAATPGASGNPVRIVAMMSAGANAEASVLAANTAVMIAMQGKRCLLIDASTSGCLQHRLFHLPDPPRAEDDVDREDLFGAITSSAIPRLSILSLPTLLHEARGRRAIRSTAELLPLAERFDVILIDAGQQTDISIVVSACEAAILIVRRDTISESLTDLSEAMSHHHVKLIGSVMVR